jgi:DNA-binding response OmpR family regulator
MADLELDPRTKEVKRSGQTIRLTARELYLLQYFIRNRGQLLSRADIAENVWNTSFESGSNIVDVYVNYLRNKIDKDFSPKLIHTVYGMGYIFKEEN